MDEQDIAGEIDRVRKRARERLRRRLPIAVVVAVVVGAGGVVVGLFASHPHRHHHDGSGAGIVASVVILLVVAAMVVVLVRLRRNGAVNYWRQPSLLLGLPRGQRRRARRDLRRGEPNPDPVLRRIEEIEAGRFERTMTSGRWLFPLLAALNLFSGLRNTGDGNAVGAGLNFAGVALFVAGSAQLLVTQRGVRAFTAP